jgi:hypothetical protein
MADSIPDTWCTSSVLGMTAYVIEVDPDGPRTQAIISIVLRDSGAAFDPTDLEERRSGEQVFEVVRLGFEVVGDATLVWQGVQRLQEKFPQLKVRIWKLGEEPPTGTHAKP